MLDCAFFMFVCFSPYRSGTYDSLFLPWNIKGNCDFISEFVFSCNCEFTVSHNSDKV